ncbi:pyridoxal 5'-phosphate synthase [Isoptericola variabilis]|uniref:Pyridoxal 5'-phosphate synthase n=1 Tax=Isoptericola variabilis (strain 225) TaxID=743718 RepID=F6FPM3_ISOV2|nr:pyridoxal 5'-phosphate synthase [Isoptericola variabilis]AEG44755.1 Pyridoxal 5'-phosphate synthase [Isoptericola variabilis 225]TWH32368.1 pyridoxamine 5'-phosphate oxidase [Isoptericola variabilis J7]
MTTFRERLRDLPVFPEDLPGWEVADLDALPATPHELFVAWFDDAVDAGLLAPHAATLSTTDAAGRVHARTLICKEVTDDGWWFAGHADSPKGRDLESNPHAALTFFWRELGRQVRVSGPVTPDAEAGAADFRARPDASRAAGLVGRQSEPLGSLAEHRAAWADALERVRAEPALVAPTWTAWVLAPTEVEFWATGTGTGQTRVRYRTDLAASLEAGDRTPAPWTKELLWP